MRRKLVGDQKKRNILGVFFGRLEVLWGLDPEPTPSTCVTLRRSTAISSRSWFRVASAVYLSSFTFCNLCAGRRWLLFKSAIPVRHLQGETSKTLHFARKPNYPQIASGKTGGGGEECPVRSQGHGPSCSVRASCSC